MNETAEFDVFVSYNTLDHAAVEQIGRALKDRGLSVFLDRWELVPGRSWPEALEGHLARCRSAAVVLGPSGLGPWQQRERALALDRQGRDPGFGVIPVILPNADTALGFLALNTWIDLRGGVDDAEAIDLLAAAVRGEPPSALLERTRKAAAQVCPYRGLEVFREEDAPFFFGREAFVEDLRAAVAAQSLVAVVGRSGSGKSSVVRAGLIPALRRPAGDLVWEIATLLPGTAPLKALAGALVPLLEPEMTETDRLVEIGKQARHLATGDLVLGDVVRRVIDKQPGTDRLLLLVDQWEELYTQTIDDEQAEAERKRDVTRFIDELLAATAAAPVTVVLTLRADFYGDALLHRRLADALPKAQVNLGPMTREELGRAVTGPAEKLDLRFDPGLTGRLLDDVGEEPGNLPLLEFALKELWSARRGDRLLHDVYQSMGGVKGAIAKRAETLYARLDPAQQGAAERAFTRLVRPGAETGDTRRRAPLAELDPAAQALVRTLAGKEARLLVTGRDPVTERETVEVAHEALIDRWGRLKGWVDKVREGLRDQLLMDELAAQWQEQGRPRLAGLASGRQLKRFERAGAASGLAAEYLHASRARRTLGRVLGGLGVVLLAVAGGGLAWLDAEGLTTRHPLAATLSAMGMWEPIEPEMALVSADPPRIMHFRMGLASADESGLGPVHEVRFARHFKIGKREVTFAEYDRFALATWRKLPDDQGWCREDRPVINVFWEEAAAYAAWLAEETGKSYRLPSEVEWEHAARGGTTTDYWWGDDVKQDGKVWANCNGCGSEWDAKQTAPVGRFPENPFGLKDTAGNVWEWVQDCWHAGYEGAPDDGSPWGEGGGGDCGRRVVRGGARKIGEINAKNKRLFCVGHTNTMLIGLR
jgi:formylglycine-generating enzyme required for sulfatase activity/energy-coupling factor transporter ATP-binding protein EcfA2